MNPHEEFAQQCRKEIKEQGESRDIKNLSLQWITHEALKHYSYHFTWLGLPIIQYPQDIVAMQELVWRVKPDLIIETGIARGGSLVFYASLLQLLEICGGTSKSQALGIDVDIRQHNRLAIESHPLYKHGKISMMQGSSIDPDMVEQVKKLAKGYRNIMVVLDSCHTHAHVLTELKAYAPLVTKGSYCVVFDTVVEDMPANAYPDREWGKGNNPASAVKEFLAENHDFYADTAIDDKLLITVAYKGYLKRK